MEITKYISIIFDDGPRFPMTEMIEKFIAKNHRCGFAIIGKNINDETEKTLKFALDNGFELCSHGQNHVGLPDLEKGKIYTELFAPIKEIERRFGYKITTARAPYLWADDKVFEVCCEHNLPLLGQGITVAHDWEDTVSAEEISTSFIKNVYDGAVICLHVKPNTLKALDEIFDFLEAENYKILTPTDLFKVKNIEKIPLDRQITRV